MELNGLGYQVSSPLDSQKIFISIWLPIILSITTIAGGVSTIWLGWRKDLRDVEELRLMLASTEKGGANPNPRQSSADTEQPPEEDAPQAVRR